MFRAEPCSWPQAHRRAAFPHSPLITGQSCPSSAPPTPAILRGQARTGARRYTHCSKPAPPTHQGVSCGPQLLGYENKMGVNTECTIWESQVHRLKPTLSMFWRGQSHPAAGRTAPRAVVSADPGMGFPSPEAEQLWGEGLVVLGTGKGTPPSASQGSSTPCETWHLLGSPTLSQCTPSPGPSPGLSFACFLACPISCSPALTVLPWEHFLNIAHALTCSWGL